MNSIEHISAFTLTEIHGTDDELALIGTGLWRDNHIQLKILAEDAEEFEDVFQEIYPLRNFIKAMYGFDEERETVFQGYEIWYPHMIQEGATHFEFNRVIFHTKPLYLETNKYSNNHATFGWSVTENGLIIRPYQLKENYITNFKYISHEIT